MPLFLAAVLTVLLVLPCTALQTGVTPRFSPVDDGKFTVTVSVSAVKNLTAAIFELDYDTSVFSLESAFENTFISDGEEYPYFPGMWQFGEKSDGSGAAGIFIKDPGVTKQSQCDMCTFVFGIKDGYSENTVIDFYIKEFSTFDGNADNDITKKTFVLSEKITLTDAERFSFENRADGSLYISKYHFHEKFVSIPESLNGAPVAGIKNGAFDGDGAVFVYIPETVGEVAPLAFSGAAGRVALVYENSAADLYAANAGIDAAVIKDGCKFYFEPKIILTDERLSVSRCFFEMRGGAVCDCLPSHTANQADHFGTGSGFRFKKGDVSADITLAVFGDLNGDSAFDVLDLALAELYVSGNSVPDTAGLFACDANGSGEADIYDYSAMVNLLSKEY